MVEKEKNGNQAISMDVAAERTAPERLRLTEDNYRTIFENSAIAITVTDKDERIVSWNRSAEALLGMNSDDLYLRHVSSLYPEEEWVKIRAQHVRRRGIQHHFETKIIRKDQQTIDVDLSLSMLKGPDGNIIGSIGIIADITERKKVEEALRTSENRYRSTLELTGQFGWTTNANGEVVDDLPEWRKYTGQGIEEVKGWGWLKAIHPDDAERTAQIWRKAVLTKTPYEAQYRIRRYDGVYRHFMARGVPVLKEDGNIREWVGICIDITSSKEAEKALRQSEELSRGMLETASTGIYLLQHGRFTYVNRLMEEILGYSSEELLGTYSLDYIHPEDREAARAKAIETLKGHRNVEHEFRVIRKDMEVIWISERITSIEYGENHAIMGTLTDITERKMAEVASQEYTKRIEALLAISAAVGQTLNLIDLLHNVLHRVFAIMNIRAAAIFLVNREANELVLKAHRGFSSNFAQRVARMKMGKGFAGRAAMLGKPIIISKSSNDMRFDPAVLEQEGLQSLYSVPIIAKDKVLGVVSIGSCEPRDLAEHDIRLLTSIATQIGVAIENAQLYEKAVEIAFTDELTGLYNRRYLMEQIGREFARAQRKRLPLSVLMIDMDGLKAVNDRYGHQRGSECLKELARVIKANTRASDIAARLGGDEFVLLAPDTEPSEAEVIAERLRAETQLNPLIDDGKISMTITIGIASFPSHAADIEGILKKADEAMYEGKRAGKNRVCVARPLPTLSETTAAAYPQPSS